MGAIDVQSSHSVYYPYVGDLVAGVEFHRDSKPAGSLYGLMKSRLQISAHKSPWIVITRAVTVRQLKNFCREIAKTESEPVEISVNPRLKVARAICIHPHVGSAHVGDVERQQIFMVVRNSWPKFVCFLEN
jgi:hypothetical protein